MKRAADSDRSQTTSARAEKPAGAMSQGDKERIIDQLGPAARNRFRGEESNEAFGAYWAYLIAKGWNVDNPRERLEGFDKWRAQFRDAAAPRQESLDLRARRKAQDFMATLAPHRPLRERASSKPEPRREQSRRDAFRPEIRRRDAARPAVVSERAARAKNRPEVSQRGDASRSHPVAELPPVALENERVNPELAAKKDRFINSLNPQERSDARQTFSGRPPYHTDFRAFLKHLDKTKLDLNNPAEAQAGFAKWRAEIDMLSDPEKYRDFVTGTLGEKAGPRFKDTMEAQKFRRFIKSKAGDPANPIDITRFCEKFHDRSFAGCLKAMSAAFEDFNIKFPNRSAQRDFHKYICAHSLHADSTGQELRDSYAQRAAKAAPAAKVLAEAAKKFGVNRNFADWEVQLYIGMTMKHMLESDNKLHAENIVSKFLRSLDERERVLHDQLGEIRGRRSQQTETEPHRRDFPRPRSGAGAAYNWIKPDQISAGQAAAPRKPLASRSLTNLSPVRKESAGGKPAVSEHDRQIRDEFERESARSAFARISGNEGASEDEPSSE